MIRSEREAGRLRENVVLEKSKAFAIRIIRLYQFLGDSKREFVLSKQLRRSGTSIGANIREAVQGFSRNDFLYKMNLALEESSETCYWLELLYETDYLSSAQYESIYADAQELLKLLTAIIKTTRPPSTP